MNIEIATEFSDVQSLEADWNKLLLNSRADTIFLTWEWTQAWVRVSGSGVKPFVISVRASDGTLIGIAPFYLTEIRMLGTLTFRTLRILGDQNTGSEYSDWIVHRDCEQEVLCAIADTLLKYSKKWDSLWMPRMSGWTGGCEKIVSILREKGFFCHLRPSRFSAFDLPHNLETYMAALSPNRRSQLRRQVKRVMSSDDMRLSRCSLQSELPRYLKKLFDLHHRRWMKKGDQGGFIRKPAVKLFYEEFAPVALREGWLRVFALENGGEDPKAIQFGYVYNSIFHQMQEGFDPEYIDGVGNVLRMKVIEACSNEGVTTYDFLGGMTDHKRRWLANERTGRDLFAGHRKNLKNRLLFAKEIWPTGRFLTERSYA